MIDKHNIPTMIIILFFLMTINCNDNSNPSSPSTSINKANLIGSWTLTKQISIESGTMPDTAIFNNEQFVKYTEDNNAINFFHSEHSDCIESDTVHYSLNGNQIYGPDGGYSNLNINGNQIITTSNMNNGSIISYYIKFTGTVPPPSWPTAKCHYFPYKKKFK